MDLFSNNDNIIAPFKGIIHEEWFQVLPGAILMDLRDALNVAYRSGDILPRKEKVLRTFLMPPSSVKVVLIGQDPYPNDNAMGLAFGCAQSESPTLRVIKGALMDEYKKFFPTNFNNNLVSWWSQGVFLLNSALTVARGHSGSHSELWENITPEIVRALLHINPKVSVHLWGTHALSGFDKVVKPYEGTTAVFRSAHPQATNYNSTIKFSGMQFSSANNYLDSVGKTEIDWFKP